MGNMYYVGIVRANINDQGITLQAYITMKK
jgi:hypothetical protein